MHLDRRAAVEVVATSRCTGRYRAAGAPGTPTQQTPSAPASAAAAGVTWTPQKLLEFVIETDKLLLAKRGERSRAHRDPKAIGECYGEPAYDQGGAAEVLSVLEGRLTGRALKCYQATYFGCRLGDRIALAGLSIGRPVALAFIEGQVRIVEQTADRVVADVPEVEYNASIDGKLDKDQVGDRRDFGIKSRYTLTRDAHGVWRISDRVPSYPEWECREK